MPPNLPAIGGPHMPRGEPHRQQGIGQLDRTLSVRWAYACAAALAVPTVLIPLAGTARRSGQPFGCALRRPHPGGRRADLTSFARRRCRSRRLVAAALQQSVRGADRANLFSRLERVDHRRQIEDGFERVAPAVVLQLGLVPQAQGQ